MSQSISRPAIRLPNHKSQLCWVFSAIDYALATAEAPHLIPTAGMITPNRAFWSPNLP